jgi:hypothetical protein
MSPTDPMMRSEGTLADVMRLQNRAIDEARAEAERAWARATAATGTSRVLLRWTIASVLLSGAAAGASVACLMLLLG